MQHPARIGARCQVTPRRTALAGAARPKAVDALQRSSRRRQAGVHDRPAFDRDGADCSSPAAATPARTASRSPCQRRRPRLARALLAQPEVKPIGLGARNSLRLEAGLCLYGADIDTTTTPVEAGLNWAMQKVRRTGGERAGNFPGAAKVLAQLDGTEPLQRKRVGLVALERVPVREHTELQDEMARIGEVTAACSARPSTSPRDGLRHCRPCSPRHPRQRHRARQARALEVAPLPSSPHAITRLTAPKEKTHDRKYTPEPNGSSWRPRSRRGLITLHAQDALGDVVFVDLPRWAAATPRARSRAWSSRQAAADIFMPLAGEVTEVNEDLRKDPRSPTRTRWAPAGSSRCDQGHGGVRRADGRARVPQVRRKRMTRC